MPATAQQHKSTRALRSVPAAARRLARRVVVKRLRLVPAGSDVRPYALPAVARVLEAPLGLEVAPAAGHDAGGVHRDGFTR